MTTGAQTPAHPNARPRRSRLRTFLPLGLAAWLVLEIWLLTVVAGATSGFVVFLLLLMRLPARLGGHQAGGPTSLPEPQRGAPARHTPSSGGGSGLMMLGGLLLMIPGLASDALGLLLLLPPVQKAVGRSAQRTVDRKLRTATPGTLGDAFQQARMHRPDGKVVQGEVIKNDERGEGEREQRPPLTP